MIKRAAWIGLTLTMGVSTACAQALQFKLAASHDSDQFDEWKLTAGYTDAQGRGLQAGTLRYSALGWSRTGGHLAGTYHHTSQRWTTDAHLGLTQLAGHQHGVGALDTLYRWRPDTSVGISVERDLVNSQRGIEDGLTYLGLSLVADHAFTERFNVGLAVGSSWFSGDNRRDLLRTRWNLLLDDSYGLNAFVKTRHYRNSHPGQAAYFSPRSLQELAAGLSVRMPMTQHTTFRASLDAGQQRIDGESDPIWHATLGWASPRGSRIDWQIGLEASNATSLFSTGNGAYRYTSLVARIHIPL